MKIQAPTIDCIALKYESPTLLQHGYLFHLLGPMSSEGQMSNMWTATTVCARMSRS